MSMIENAELRHPRDATAVRVVGYARAGFARPDPLHCRYPFGAIVLWEATKWVVHGVREAAAIESVSRKRCVP